MSNAAEFGHMEIVQICKEYGATDFNEALYSAAMYQIDTRPKRLCNSAVLSEPEVLKYIPDLYKTKEMCE